MKQKDCRSHFDVQAGILAMICSAAIALTLVRPDEILKLGIVAGVSWFAGRYAQSKGTLGS